MLEGYQTTYEKALKRFEKYLKSIDVTPFYEVRSFKINDLEGMKKALSSVEKGTAVWQHTDEWHSVGMYIKAGSGHKFNRKVTNLFRHDITNEKSFRRAWIQQNGNNEIGVFPKAPGDFTSRERQKQKSYIVADQSKENPNSKISGSFKKNQVHRTHLISSQITGIEHSKGFLIDFDGWLNSKPMNEFELKAIDKSDFQDIIWTTNVWIAGYLHLKYEIYDKDYNLIAEQEWVDDRWQYCWRFDRGQDKLTKKY